MKRKLFFLLSALLLGLTNISADVILETDMTTQFNSLATTQWTGSSGQVGWAAPKVTTNSGLTVAAWERYNESCYWTGDIMHTTVTGLAAGTYKIELYGAAAFTFGRGFGSEAFTGSPSKATSDTYTENQSITENTGVLLYATTSEGNFEDEIPIWYATNFNTSGIATVSLSGVVVGGNGQITIGMKKTSNSTNWHVVQLKGVTATVSGDAVIASLLPTAQGLLSNVMSKGARTALTTAINNASDVEQTVAAYQAVIGGLNTAISNAEASIADYASLKAAIDNAYVSVFAAGKAISEPAIATAQGVYDAAEVDDCSAAIAALTDALHGAYEADYNAFANDYAYDYSTLLNPDLTKWAQSDYVVLTANEHWSGNTYSYYEQSGAEWGQSSWSHSASQAATLPAGHYVMSITARAAQEVTSTMSVKIGDNEPIVASLPHKNADGRGIMIDGVGSYQDGEYAKSGAGYGWEYRFIAFTLEEETPVTFGFNSSSNTQHTWVSISNPLLKGDVHPNQVKLNQVHALATELKGYDGKISADTYAAFAEDLAAADAATVESENLDDIITSLQSDITTAQAEYSAYETLGSAIDYYSEKAALLDAAGQAAFDISDIVANYNARIYHGTEAVEVVIIIRNTYVSAVKAQTTPGADMTDALVNPSFETGNLDGWSDNGMVAQGNDSFEKVGNYYAEAWEPNGSYIIHQTVENLPAGVYRVSAITKARGVISAALYGNVEEIGIEVSDETSRYNVEFTLDEAGSPTIGFQGEGDGTANSWLCVDDFTLTYLGSSAAAALNKLIAEAEVMVAADPEAVAIGKLQDAIDVAKAVVDPTDDDITALQNAIDQFIADNADVEKDETAKVATDGWKKYDGTAAGVCATQYAPAITTYDGRNAQLAESYEQSTAEGQAVTRLGTIIYQDITGLENGSYKVGFYGNAFFTPGRGMESPMEDGAEDVAYVFANDQQAFITARIATETDENDFRQFDVEVTDGAIRLGMGKEKAGTNWHTMQIYQLTWFTTAKAVYAADKVEMGSLLNEAYALNEDPYKTEGKAEFAAAIADAEAALASNKLNVPEFETEIDKLKAAIEVFKKANWFIDFSAGEYYIIDPDNALMMAAGHNYGTRGILNEMGLDLTLTPNTESRTVTIDSRVSNGGNNHFLGKNLYMDSSEWGWALEYQGFGFNILEPESGKYISIDADNNLVLSDTPREFIIVTKDGVMAQLMEEMADATKDAPVDATRLIKANNFNRNDARNAEAWNVSDDCTNYNLSGGNQVNNCAESYHSTFTIKQVLSDAPAGVYKLEAQGFYRQDLNDDDEEVTEETPVFFIGDATTAVPVKTGEEGSMTDASVSFTEGKYNIEPLEFVYNGEGDLEVGIRGTALYQWVIFDNFRLTYYGPAQYAVTVAPAENGSAGVDKSEAAEGETVTVTFAPATGYKVKSANIVYNETQMGLEIEEGNIAHFEMPAAPVTVVVVFDATTGINSLEEAAEGESLKDGKYLIKGEIIIVEKGKKYTAGGQLK